MKRLSALVGLAAIVVAVGCDDGSSGSGGSAGAAGTSGSASRTSGGPRPSYVENQFKLAEAASKGEYAAGGAGVMPLTKSDILEYFGQRLQQIESQADQIVELATAAGESWAAKAQEMKTLIEAVKAKREQLQPMDPMDLTALKPVALELEGSYGKLAGVYRELRGQFGSQLSDMQFGAGGQANRTEGGPPPGVGPRGPGGQ